MTNINCSIHTDNLIIASHNFIDKIISRGGSPWWDDKEFYDGAPDGIWSQEKREEFSHQIKILLYSYNNRTNLELEVVRKRLDMIRDRYD